MSMKLMITTASVLAVLAGPALAANHVVPKGAHAQAPGADASFTQGFEGWPSDYLINRFGDHQMQGR
jgi:hypothetical protein